MFRVVLVLISLALLYLNLKASSLILKDSILESKVRVFQLLFVWLIPALGASLVLAIYRPLEKSSGAYPEDIEQQDSFLGGNTGKQIYDEITNNN